MSTQKYGTVDYLDSLLDTQRKEAGPGTDLWENIGNTPLIRLDSLTQDISPKVQILAKAEWFNPGGSVKDRPALQMILEGERSGILTEDKILLDASSGNTALAYAMIGAARGYKVKLCVPANVSADQIKILQAYGAEIVLTDPAESTDGAIRKAREIFKQDPELHCYLDQYNNEANWKAHFETTGKEIWRQTRGTITHFVAGLGTSGTFTGTGRRLKEYNPSIRLISMQPASPLHGLEGLKHMETAIVPGIYDKGLADEAVTVSTEDAQQMVKRLAREEGMFVGLSAGAAAVASQHVAQSLDSGVVVTVFPDGGRRYIGEKFWEEK